MIWRWYEERRLRLLAQGLEGRVLDIGYADWPNRHFSSRTEVTGVDLAAAPPIPGYCSQLVGDFHGHPDLIGIEFDVVVAGEVIEHVEEPFEFLRRCRDVLRPGGEIRISTPNPVGFPVVFFEWAQSTQRFFEEDHDYYITPRWMKKMLESAGFLNVKTRAVGTWIPGIPLPWSPVALSYQVIYSGVRSA